MFTLPVMKFSATLLAAALGAAGCLFWTGCFPPSRGQTPEEKESHFITGKNRVNAMDYTGAVKSFEKALEVNPRSAAAHFELGCLFLNHEKDPAAAIYHFQSYLKLSPGAHDAEVIKQHIMGCKQELAKQVSLGPITAGQQRDLERLAEENKRLQEESRRSREELASLRLFLATNRPPVNPQLPGRSGTENRLESAGAAVVGGGASSAPGVTPGRRTYIVRQGDTMAAIARRHGVKLTQLQAANPAIDPRRLRPGQTVYLPESR